MTTARRTILALGLVVLDGAIGCASTGERTRAGWANITSSPREQEAAASQPKSPSGRPEVIVPGATKKQVMDALTLRLASSGWNVTQINDYQAIYDTDAKGAVGFLSGVVYGQATKPLYRLTAQFLETQTGVRLIGNLELVTNPGTPSPIYS